MIDGQDSDPYPQDNPSNRYRGEFTVDTAHELVREVQQLDEAAAEDYFAVLRGAVAAQGQPDMAAAIERLSKTSTGTLLRGSFEPVVTGLRDGKPTSTKPAEQWAREYVAFSLGIALSDLYELNRGHIISRGDNVNTHTLADLQVGGDLNKELFVIFARILAREPERLDSTPPTADQVTDIGNMSISPENRALGVVTLEGQPDKIVRFQKVTVDSTVPGYNFETWRHNRAGYIRGDESDYHKLYLVRK